MADSKKLLYQPPKYEEMVFHNEPVIYSSYGVNNYDQKDGQDW